MRSIRKIFSHVLHSPVREAVEVIRKESDFMAKGTAAGHARTNNISVFQLGMSGGTGERVKIIFSKVEVRMYAQRVTINPQQRERLQFTNPLAHILT